MDNQPFTLFIAGDSTASCYPKARYPREGWGMQMAGRFSSQVIVRNEAASGRSSKSFIDEGRLSSILKEMKCGDYLFIQFGHNDEKNDEVRHTDPFTTYQTYLSQYVNGARDKGGIPVLLTPVERRSFNAEGEFQPSHGEYPKAMRQLAGKLNVPLLDLCERSQQLFIRLGPDASKKLFLWLEPGIYPGYPQGECDDTHFSVEGAMAVSELVAEAILDMKLPLASYLRNAVCE